MMHSHMRVRISRKSERVNAPAMTEKETNQKNLRAFLVYFACKVVGASKAGFFNPFYLYALRLRTGERTWIESYILARSIT